MRVQGFIYGDDGISNVLLIKSVVTLTGSDGSYQTIEINPGEQYTIDGDLSEIGGYTVLFSAPGFKSYGTTVNELASGASNIHLEKGAGSNTVLVLGGAALLGLALASKKKRIGATDRTDYTPIVLIAGGVLVVGLVSKILDKLGLGGDPTVPHQSDPNSPFKPAYWRQFKTFTYAITTSQAKAYAETIHDAFGLFQDDFNAVMSVFSQMRTKANVSYLADIFSQEYQEDLLSFLTDGGGILPWDGLSKEHLQTILAYVNNLPTN